MVGLRGVGGGLGRVVIGGRGGDAGEETWEEGGKTFGEEV